ncbi:MAG: BMP family protein [Chthonomonas sp.]|nr:BMP family protein [Chthonomonas sp.]
MTIRFGLIALSVLAAIAGCGNKPTEEQPAASGGGGAKSDKEFKVALLTPGPVSDSGWNAMANDGLIQIEGDLGAKITQRESTGTKIRDDLRAFGQEGYSLVIGHGYEYNEPAVEVSKDFPDTVFVTSSGGKSSKNSGAFRFYLEQGFYIAGYVAGSMTKSGKVAMIGGPDVPSIRSTFKGFRAGALAANPNVKVIETFTGKESDVAAAKLATTAALAEGADFVIHQANAAAQGVFDACKEKGAFAFGANSDQNSNASGVVIGSALINAKPAFVALAREVKEGKYGGGIKLMGIDIGAIDFVWNPALDAKVPAELKEKVKTLADDLRTGKILAPKDEF